MMSVKHGCHSYFNTMQKCSSVVDFQFHGLVGKNGIGRVQEVGKAVKNYFYALFGVMY